MKRKAIFIFLIFLFLALVLLLGARLSLFFEGKKQEVKREGVKLLPGKASGGENITSPEGSFSKNFSSEGVSLESIESQKKAVSLGERLIIFNRTITLEVRDVRKSAWLIEKLAGEYGGYVQSLRFGKPVPYPLEMGRGKEAEKQEVEEGTIIVKVPAEKFKAFSEEIRKLGRLIEDLETAEEVTETYIDLSARLRNLEKEEERLLEIFSSAKKVEEMLMVERELQRIRGEIESLTAQKANLEKSARFAVFTIYLRTPEAIVSPPDSSWGFGEALRQAVRNFVAVVNGMVVVTGTVLPLLIVGLIFYFGYKLRLVLMRPKGEQKELS